MSFIFVINLLKSFILKVTEYIRDLLLFHEKLTLSGFGTFEIIRQSAVLKEDKIIPPVSSVVFNPSLTDKDDTLVLKIADAEETEPEIAEARVNEFISEARLTLNRGEDFYMEGFGMLKSDENNNIFFEKDETLILDFEDGSFEAFELEPLEESEIQDNDLSSESVPEAEQEEIINPEYAETAPDETIEMHGSVPEEYDLVEEKKSNRNFIRLLSGSIVVIIISLIILTFTTDIPERFNVRPRIPVEKTGKPAYIIGDTDEFEKDMEAAVDSLTRIEHALRITDERMEELVTTSAYAEYHIIAGSFSVVKNADELQKQLSLKGYPSLIINRGDGFYRVSAISFPDKEKAIQEVEKFRRSTQYKAAWVLGLN